MVLLEVQQLEAQQAREQEELQRQILRAQDSEHLLSNPTLAAWFQDMEDQCVNEIEDRGLSDPNVRARCVDLIVMLRKLRKSLEYYVEEGKFSRQRLDELLELKSKKSMLGGLFG